MTAALCSSNALFCWLFSVFSLSTFSSLTTVCVDTVLFEFIFFALLIFISMCFVYFFKFKIFSTLLLLKFFFWPQIFPYTSIVWQITQALFIYFSSSSFGFSLYIWPFSTNLLVICSLVKNLLWILFGIFYF